MKIDSNAQTIIALAAAGLAVYWVTSRDLIKAAEVVGESVNPVNPDNVFNSGVDAVGKSVSGDDGWTLGGWVYDMTHPDAGWDPDVESEL